MNTETFNPTPEEIYYAAEKYLSLLSEPLASQIKALILDQSQTGQKVDNDILTLISEDENARKWMREALFGGESGQIIRADYSPLPGGLLSVSANSIWICPKIGCGFEWRVIRTGRPVPTCPRHFSVLVKK